MSASAPATVSSSDHPLANPAASAVGTEVARRAQMRQMQIYVANMSGFFEGVLTNLLLEQPADPHAFLLQALNATSVSEREGIVANIAKQDERKNNQEDPLFNRARNTLVLNSTFLVNGTAGAKKTVVSILQGLQRYARTQAACTRFEIGTNESTPNEVIVQQAWASQQGLDAYHASTEFQRAQPLFKGLVTNTPDARVFQCIIDDSPSA